MSWVLAACLTVFSVAVAPAEPTGVAADEVKTGIEFNVKPASAKIFVDGKQIGTAGEVSFVKTKPGRHNVRLVRNGDETEIDLEVGKGQVVQFTYEF